MLVFWNRSMKLLTMGINWLLFIYGYTVIKIHLRHLQLKNSLPIRIIIKRKRWYPQTRENCKMPMLVGAPDGTCITIVATDNENKLDYLKERNYLRVKFSRFSRILAKSPPNFGVFCCFSELAKLTLLHKVLYQLTIVVSNIFYGISNNISRDNI